MTYKIHWPKLWSGYVHPGEIEAFYWSMRGDFRQHASFSRPAYVDDPGEGSEE